jgi:hypothetical protein
MKTIWFFIKKKKQIIKFESKTTQTWVWLVSGDRHNSHPNSQASSVEDHLRDLKIHSSQIQK